MSTHDTDDREIGHANENYGVDSEGDELAEEQAAEAQAEDPVPGYFDRDEADAAEDTDAAAEDTGAGGIDTGGLADPEADTAAEADLFADGDDGSDGDDDATGDPIALGPTEADVAAAEVADREDADTVAATADEPTIVEHEDTDVRDTDADADAAGLDADDTADADNTVDADNTDIDDTDTDDTEDWDPDARDDDDVDADAAADESVLLTESEPGSVLPPPEDDTDGAHEATAVPSDPRVQLEPVGSDAPLDPGSGTYQERWSAIQGAFVDEPYRAVESAGGLVAQMWHDFERAMADQRAALDDGWSDSSSTDDLRAAFRQYRELYQRFGALLESI